MSSGCFLRWFEPFFVDFWVLTFSWFWCSHPLVGLGFYLNKQWTPQILWGLDQNENQRTRIWFFFTFANRFLWDILFEPRPCGLKIAALSCSPPMQGALELIGGHGAELLGCICLASKNLAMHKKRFLKKCFVESAKQEDVTEATTPTKKVRVDGPAGDWRPGTGSSREIKEGTFAHTGFVSIPRLPCGLRQHPQG